LNTGTDSHWGYLRTRIGIDEYPLPQRDRKTTTVHHHAGYFTGRGERLYWQAQRLTVCVEDGEWRCVEEGNNWPIETPLFQNK
jgi:hypothetical protein